MRAKAHRGTIVLAGVLAGVLLCFVLLFGNFHTARLHADLSSGELLGVTKKWWGLSTDRHAKPTWVSEHASASDRDPVIGFVHGHGNGLFSSGYRATGTHRYVMDDVGALRVLDEAGSIPEAMKTPLADAVIRQWLRLYDDPHGAERQRDSIAISVAYMADNEVKLTPGLLARLDAGETWDQILYPE